MGASNKNTFATINFFLVQYLCEFLQDETHKYIIITMKFHWIFSQKKTLSFDRLTYMIGWVCVSKVLYILGHFGVCVCVCKRNIKDKPYMLEFGWFRWSMHKVEGHL